MGIFYKSILSLVFALTHWNWLYILNLDTTNYTSYHIEILYTYINIIYIRYIYIHISIKYMIITQMMTVYIHLYALQTTPLRLVRSGGTKKFLRVTPEPGSNYWENSFNRKGIRSRPQKWINWLVLKQKMVYCTHNIHVFDIFEICKQRKKSHLYNNHTKRKYRNDNVKYILQVVYKQKIILLSHQIPELRCSKNWKKTTDRPTDKPTLKLVKCTMSPGVDIVTIS